MDDNGGHVTQTQAYIRGDQSGGRKGRFTAERGVQFSERGSTAVHAAGCCKHLPII